MSEKISIARYNCTVGDKRGEFGDCMGKSATGRWVTFEQHQRQITHLSTQLRLLRKETAK